MSDENVVKTDGVVLPYPTYPKPITDGIVLPYPEPIVRPVGERVAVTGGRDYDTPVARIVPSTYRDAQDHEKAIHISQGKNMGISVSLSTLEMIVRWAKGEV